MARKRLRWQLYPSYLLITILAVVALAWWAIRSQERFYLSQVNQDLISRAWLIEEQVARLVEEGAIDEVASLVNQLGSHMTTRITVILPDGRVIADTDEDPAVMDNHAQRPEIRQALHEGSGSAIRYSNTLKRDLMYVALKCHRDGRLLCTVRTAQSVAFIDQALAQLRLRMFIGGLSIALLAALVSYFVSSLISRPLEHLRAGARRFARGNLRSRLAVPNSEEIGGLAEAMNEMAAQLHQRINTITKQRQEQEAVLSSMVEGVVAVDTDVRLLNINQAAAELLGVEADRVIGNTVHEVIRNTKLQTIIAHTLSTRETMQEEVVFTHHAQDRSVQVSATTLRDSGGHRIGVVVVLNDVTQLRRLENVRRDFVANVSHELKTPITSIKASVETLLDGALENAEDARRFLKMTARQADRLHLIVEDLLSLSRIERDVEREEIRVEPAHLHQVLESALQACETTMSEKGIHVDLECHPDLVVPANAHLLEQAVVNLIDNAIKYSVAGQTVEVRAGRTEDKATIAVIDNGRGIDPEHHDRLFERFYRIDRARSRNQGGTGLGLAIVKHIALAHHGRVTVESAPDRGSTFTIYLPLREVVGSLSDDSPSA